MAFGGDDTDLTNDGNILDVKSPQEKSGGEHWVNGPYIVVHKNTESRWAIVALDFDDTPELGIRWFTDTSGNPISRKPTWFIIPRELCGAILDALSLPPAFREIIDDFLSSSEKRITGKELAVLGQLKAIMGQNGVTPERIHSLCAAAYRKITKGRVDLDKRDKATRRVKDILGNLKDAFNKHDKAAENEAIRKIEEEEF